MQEQTYAGYQTPGFVFPTVGSTAFPPMVATNSDSQQRYVQYNSQVPVGGVICLYTSQA